MFRTFFLVAIRNLKRNKVFSVINIAGLALGLTCSLLIMLWVVDEKSVDKFHANDQQLYSVYERQYADGKVSGQYYTPGLLARELKKEIPEVELASATSWNQTSAFRFGDKILEMAGSHADNDFFKMMSYPLVEGNAQTALATPSSLAISRKMAEAFFGTAQAAFGKTLRIDNRKDFLVSAVYENMPLNSTHQWDYIINWHDLLEVNSWAKEWDNNGPSTMLQLRANADPAKVEAKIKDFVQKRMGETSGWKVELYLQKYSDKYLHSNFKDGFLDGGRIEYVRLFSIVSVFILIIACINFMNLTTARSVKRSKEIGVRKVVGALRPALIRQFLGEALVVTCIAMLLSLFLLYSLLPFFNQLTQKQIVFPFQNTVFWISIAGLTIITGLLAGSYPALFLSSFKPIVVLKGVFKVKGSANWLRKGLVVFQFVLSSLLIIGTIIVSQQVQFIQQKNLGYDRNNLVKVVMGGDLVKNYEVFRQRALQIPGITGVTRAEQDPVQVNNTTLGISWEGKDPNSKPMFSQIAVGYDFTGTMQLKMAQGRDFSPAYGTDTAGYILNEAAIKKIGYTNPVGKPFNLWGKNGTIIGVVKDFHYNSMHEPIGPMVIHLNPTPDWGLALVRVDGKNSLSAITAMEKLAKELNPEFPFSYSFTDDDFRQLYTAEALINRLSQCFAGLAIVISCLGLLGLAMFAAEQRVREIGIRKVLGAGLGSLFGLLSREFLILVLVAILIACPIAWWAMKNWLNDFEYRIAINAWPFIIAGMAALAIALFTISFQTVKAALANPVKSLRSE